jgi:hypothetical protein
MFLEPGAPLVEPHGLDRSLVLVPTHQPSTVWTLGDVQVWKRSPSEALDAIRDYLLCVVRAHEL